MRVRGSGGRRARAARPVPIRVAVRVRRNTERLHPALRLRPRPFSGCRYAAAGGGEEVHALARLGRRLGAEEERELGLRDRGRGHGQEGRQGRRPAEFVCGERGRGRGCGRRDEGERLGVDGGGEEGCCGRQGVDLALGERGTGVSNGVLGFGSRQTGIRNRGLALSRKPAPE